MAKVKVSAGLVPSGDLGGKLPGLLQPLVSASVSPGLLF